jgi:hypothetical protein
MQVLLGITGAIALPDAAGADGDGDGAEQWLEYRPRGLRVLVALDRERKPLGDIFFAGLILIRKRAQRRSKYDCFWILRGAAGEIFGDVA